MVETRPQSRRAAASWAGRWRMAAWQAGPWTGPGASGSTSGAALSDPGRGRHQLRQRELAGLGTGRGLGSMARLSRARVRVLLARRPSCARAAPAPRGARRLLAEPVQRGLRAARARTPSSRSAQALGQRAPGQAEHQPEPPATAARCSTEPVPTSAGSRPRGSPAPLPRAGQRGVEAVEPGPIPARSWRPSAAATRSRARAAQDLQGPVGVGEGSLAMSASAARPPSRPRRRQPAATRPKNQRRSSSRSANQAPKRPIQLAGRVPCATRRWTRPHHRQVLQQGQQPDRRTSRAQEQAHFLPADGTAGGAGAWGMAEEAFRVLREYVIASRASLPHAPAVPEGKPDPVSNREAWLLTIAAIENARRLARCGPEILEALAFPLTFP